MPPFRLASLAASVDTEMNHEYFRGKLPKFNILFSFYYTQKPELYYPFAKSILVDSGAFTLQQRVHPNIDAYFKNYCKFINKYKDVSVIDGFFELDIDNRIGYPKVLDYREKLFEITDKIIPVWHNRLGVQEYKDMVKKYDWIGIGCVNDRNLKKESYMKFVRYAHKNNCKIHGLGMLRPSILDKVPFDTTDGTSWFKIPRFGRYNGKKLETKYIKKNRVKLVYIELMEHIRMQEEYYQKWKQYHND